MPASSIKQLVRANEITHLDPRVKDEPPPPYSCVGLSLKTRSRRYISRDTSHTRVLRSLMHTPKINSKCKAGIQHAYKDSLWATMLVHISTVHSNMDTQDTIKQRHSNTSLFCLRRDCIRKSAVERKKTVLRHNSNKGGREHYYACTSMSECCKHSQVYTKCAWLCNTSAAEGWMEKVPNVISRTGLIVWNLWRTKSAPL